MAPDDEGCEGRLLSDLERGEKERIAQLESANGLRQFDLVQDVITTFLEPERPFALRPSLIQQLQAVAVKNIDPYPEGGGLVQPE